MKWSLNWIEKQPNQTFTFEENVTFPKEMFKSMTSINDLKDVVVSGKGKLFKDTLYLDLDIKGTMILPCANTLEPVNYKFEVQSTETFVKDQVIDVDAHLIRKGNVDALDVVWQLIVMEIPLRVTSDIVNTQTFGKGWSIISEDEMLEKTNEDSIDPRLAKLQDYFKEK